MVPDEVVASAVGHYGVPPAPIDPDVLPGTIAQHLARGARR